MSEYTITRTDAEPEKRTWRGGHYAVRNERGTVALFLFEYPETITKVCASNEVEAQQLAESFIAIMKGREL